MAVFGETSHRLALTPSQVWVLPRSSTSTPSSPYSFSLKLGFKADERDYGVGASIIRELGIRKMRLMTNNPSKRAGLEGYGLTIDEIVPIVIEPNLHNMRYLSTKQERMHHTLGIETDHKE